MFPSEDVTVSSLEVKSNRISGFKEPPGFD